jgi:hypothetical protein
MALGAWQGEVRLQSVRTQAVAIGIRRGIIHV